MVALSSVGLALIWAVLTKSLVAYLAEAAPQRALWFDPAEPMVLVDMVDKEVNSDTGLAAMTQGSSTERFVFRSSSGTAAATADVAVAQPLLTPQKSRELHDKIALALRSNPLNAKAYRLLGQIASDAGDTARIQVWMRAAAERSLRESLAIFWLLRKSADVRDQAAVIRYGDVLMRTRVRAAPFVVPIMAKAAEDRASVGALSAALAANPPWRSRFFAALPGSISDARTPLALLLALKQTPFPPTPSEVKGYLDLLLGSRLYDLAYYTWLQMLTAEQLGNTGLLFNGSFETPPSTLPFDWALRAGQGSSAEVVDRGDLQGHKALLVEFSQGRVDFGGVSQITMLAPGQHQLKGFAKGQLQGPRGLVWRVTCLNNPSRSIGDSAMLMAPIVTWKVFEFSFVVPPSDCRAQQLTLVLDARSASEQLVTGSFWFDDLRIARVEAVRVDDGAR